MLIFIDLFTMNNDEAFRTELTISYVIFLSSLWSHEARQEMKKQFFSLEDSLQAIGSFFAQKSKQLSCEIVSNFLYWLVIYGGYSEKIDRLRMVCSVLEALLQFINFKTSLFLFEFLAKNCLYKRCFRCCGV